MNDQIMLVLVLNKSELLDDLLVALSDEGLPSATVLNSMGMMKKLSTMEDQRIISTLRPMILTNHEDNKTLFMIVDSKKADLARKIIRSVLGDMSKPDIGILFGLPVLFTEGIISYDEDSEV